MLLTTAIKGSPGPRLPREIRGRGWNPLVLHDEVEELAP